MIEDIKDQLLMVERITSVMPQPSLKSRLSGAFFMNWEIRLAPHGAAPHTTFMMMMMIDMYFFEFWAIQLRITGPKEIQSPERLYKYATIVGNRFSFQYDILSYAQNL